MCVWGGEQRAAGCNHMCASITRAHRDTASPNSCACKIYTSILPARPIVSPAGLQRGVDGVCVLGFNQGGKHSGDGGRGTGGLADFHVCANRGWFASNRRTKVGKNARVARIPQPRRRIESDENTGCSRCRWETKPKTRGEMMKRCQLTFNL